MILDIGDKYLEFFVRNIHSRYVLIQGSRRSAKSFSVYKWLYFLSSGKTIEHNLVVTASFPALQNAISDFERATGARVEGSQINGFHTKLPNGSTFRFKSMDEGFKAQGVSATRVFYEEALNIDEGVITTLSMSAEKQLYFAYNPTKKSNIDKYIKPDKTNWLKTTYEDNPWLSEEQKSEFYFIRERAMSPTASVLDKYAYNVYVLGEFSSMAGKVFKQIWNCTDEEYDSIKAGEYYGLDFGFVDSNDQTVLVGAKIYNRCLYLKEYIYSNTLSKDYDLAWAMVNAGITPQDAVFADYGGLGKSRIDNLVSANNGEWSESPINKGFQVYNAVKGKVVDGI